MAAKTGHSSDRRQWILQAAERAFDARGYASTTMEAIADEAGIAKGSIYNYFQSKHDLFSHVVTEALAGDEARADQLSQQELPAAEKLMGLLDDWYERIGQYHQIGRLVLEAWAAAAREQEAGSLAAFVAQMQGRWHQRVAAIIARGVASGEFRAETDVDMAASLLMAVGNGATLGSILGTGMKVNQEFLAVLKQAMLAALGAGPDRQGHTSQDV